MTAPADFSDALEAYLDLAVPDRAKNATRRRVRSALSDMYLIECGSDQARMLEAVTDDLDELLAARSEAETKELLGVKA